jgi:hypothetical protein
MERQAAQEEARAEKPCKKAPLYPPEGLGLVSAARKVTHASPRASKTITRTPHNKHTSAALQSHKAACKHHSSSTHARQRSARLRSVPHRCVCEAGGHQKLARRPVEERRRCLQHLRCCVKRRCRAEMRDAGQRRAMLCNAVQCRAGLRDAGQCRAMLRSAVRCRAMLCSAVRCRAEMRDAGQRRAMLCGAVRCRAELRDAGQRRATLCGAVRCRA